MEKIKAIELPESLGELKQAVERHFIMDGAGRTVDDWIIMNVNTAVESGNLVGLTDREKYIFGLAVIASKISR